MGDKSNENFRMDRFDFRVNKYNCNNFDTYCGSHYWTKIARPSKKTGRQNEYSQNSNDCKDIWVDR